MKKPLKIALTAAAALAAMAEYNRYIEKKSAKKISRMDLSKNRTYHWHYGKINYTVKGSGAPLLLVHGINTVAGAVEFERADALSRHFKVYKIDLLGFGFSDKPNLTYSSYMYASLIADFIRDVIGTPAHVAASGQSAGFASAVTYLNRGLIKKMILVSPETAGFDGGTAGFVEKLTGLALDLPVIGTFLFNILFSYPMILASVKTNTSIGKKSAEDFSRGLYMAWHNGFCKKSVVSSMLSGLFSSSRNLFERLPVPSLVIDHPERFPHIENPGEFCRAVIRFLEN